MTQAPFQTSKGGAESLEREITTRTHELSLSPSFQLPPDQSDGVFERRKSPFCFRVIFRCFFHVLERF
jgi:hypothetical protein